MRPFTRRLLLIGVALIFLIAVGATVHLLTRGESLKSRAARISPGMPRKEVEEIFGPPVIVLKRTGGRGELLSWVDYLWQVDVLTGPDGRVESINCHPSDSFYRRTVGRVFELPQ